MARRDSFTAISASSLGAAAWCVAKSECAARVVGVTSRGLFLLAPPQRIIFVSFERYRSPLTINLDRSCDRLRTIDVAAVAQFFDTRLIFPSIDFSISFSEEMVWRCPLPELASRPHAEQRQTAQAIARRVLMQRGDVGLAALLPILLDWPAVPALSAEQSALLEQLLALRRAVQAGDNAALLAGLTASLGQGRGLTPSGDDVVIGLLLMLARSLRVNSRADGENMLKHVTAQLVTEAYQKTTSISANLIECAADGQGDERLIAVADGIATGTTSITQCVEDVLGWGSSSGIEALVGMAVAVAAF
jgi:hypothetical protein